MIPGHQLSLPAVFRPVLLEREKGNHEEALRNAVVIYFSRGGDTISTFVMASLLKEAGRLGEALDLLEKATVHSPDDELIVLARVNMLTDFRLYRESKDILFSIPPSPLGLKTLKVLIIHILSENNAELAAGILRCAICCWPNDAELWLHTAGAASSNGGAARKAAEIALRLAPLTSSAWIERALSWRVEGDMVACIDDCRRALALEPDRWEALFTMFRAATTDASNVSDQTLALILRCKIVASHRTEVEFMAVAALAQRSRQDCGTSKPLENAFGIKSIQRNYLKVFANLPWNRLATDAAAIGLLSKRYAEIKDMSIVSLAAFAEAAGVKSEQLSLPPSEPVNWRAFPSDFERFQPAVDALERQGVTYVREADFMLRHHNVSWPVLFDERSIIADVVNETPISAWPDSSFSGHVFFRLDDEFPIFNSGGKSSALMFVDRDFKYFICNQRGIVLRCSENYGHYLIDFMTRICAVMEMTNELQRLPILCAPLPSYAREMISLFGFENIKFIELPVENGAFIKFHQCALVGATPYGSGFLALKNRYLSRHPRQNRRRRIYLSRGELPANKRRLINEEEVALFLSQEGFEVIYSSLLNVERVAAAVRDAEIIVSPMGAGTSNLLFADKSCIFIELFNPSFHASRWLSYSHSVLANFGVRYRRVIGQSLSPTLIDGDLIDQAFAIAITPLSAAVRNAIRDVESAST